MSMNRRSFLKSIAFGAFLLMPLARALSQELLTQYGNVKVSKNIQRVFAAGPPAAVFLYTLSPEKLLGWPSKMSAEALSFLHPAQQQLPYMGRLAGRGSTVSMESLLLANPDVIVDVGVVGETQRSQAVRVMQQTQIPVWQLAGNLLSTPQQYREMGDMLGVQERAEQLAQYSEQLLHRALQFAKQQKQQGRNPKRIYLVRSLDGLETGLAGSIHGEVIELLGCVNVAQIPNQHGVAQVSLEQIHTWQPDYILCQGKDFLQWVQHAPQWQTIQAVQQKQIYAAPILPFGWLDGPPGVNRLLGVLWLLALLEDRLYAESFKQEVQEFFSLFYRSQVDLESLLS